MAQLFTVCFPKYCFQVQDTFSLDFTADNLPFEYTVAENGNAHVSIVKEEDEKKQDKRLTEGLTITAINGESIAQDIRDDAGSHEYVTRDGKRLTKHDLDLKIKTFGNKKIAITFKEDVAISDKNQALGLESGEITDKAISASSYNPMHPPSDARLNNADNKHWSPTEADEKSRDVWICIDLQQKRTVDKICIQGSQKHDQHVQELWIEYSQDLCSWKSHTMGVIKCHYREGHQNQAINEEKETNETKLSDQIEEIKMTELKPDALEQQRSLCRDFLHRNPTPFAMATIKLWPVIHARFVRIRPWEWTHHISMRIELFGHREFLENRHILRVVDENNVSPSFKHQMKNSLKYHRTKYPQHKHEIGQSQVIQTDCKALVTEAMEKARFTSYGIMEADHNNYLLVFTTKNSVMTETIMDELGEIGVGEDMGVISATSIDWRHAAKDIDEVQSNKSNENKSSWASSITAHQAVKIVIQRVLNNAAFTFDYFCMLMVASLIAVGGLATNSSVIVVASMLVSPIMGPVLAFTFGVTLRNWHMAKLGLVNECFSLFVCLLTGFVVGFFWALGTNNRNDWPTDEMASRGAPYALADGAYIAAASGIGVALALVGDYLTTVVGVAISASLLPPAVNCGMLLSFTIYEKIYPQYVSHEFDVEDTVIMACISLILTIENIIIIFLSATIMFKVKEIKTDDHTFDTVWRHVTHIKTKARKLKKQQVHVSAFNILDNDDDDDDDAFDTAYRKKGSNSDKAITQLSRVRKHSLSKSGTLKRSLLRREYAHKSKKCGNRDKQTLTPLATINEKKAPTKRGYTGVTSHDLDYSSEDGADCKEEEQNDS